MIRIDKSLYPDAAARAEFYAKGLEWGFLTSEDIRDLEDMEPQILRPADESKKTGQD